MRRPVATSNRSARSGGPASSSTSTPSAAAGDRPCAHSGAHVDALAREHLGDQRARLGLLGRQQPLRPLDDRHLRSEPGEDLGELDADGATPQDGERPRQLLGLHGLVIGPVLDGVEPGKRRDRRSRPRREHDPTPGLERAIADLHPAGAVEAAGTAHEPSALSLEPLDGHAVVPRVGRLGADPRGDGRPVGIDRARAGELGDAPCFGEQRSRPAPSSWWGCSPSTGTRRRRGSPRSRQRRARRPRRAPRAARPRRPCRARSRQRCRSRMRSTTRQRPSR